MYILLFCFNVNHFSNFLHFRYKKRSRPPANLFNTPIILSATSKRVQRVNRALPCNYRQASEVTALYTPSSKEHASHTWSTSPQATAKTKLQSQLCHQQLSGIRTTATKLRLHDFHSWIGIATVRPPWKNLPTITPAQPSRTFIDLVGVWNKKTFSWLWKLFLHLNL